MNIHPDIFLFATLLFLIFGMTARTIYNRVKRRQTNHKPTKAIKYIGQISLALGILLQLTELSTALGHTTRSLTPDQIAGGLRSTLFPTIHGLFVYIIAMVLYTILRLTEKNDTV